jgi:hypothetical protein
MSTCAATPGTQSLDALTQAGVKAVDSVLRAWTELAQAVVAANPLMQAVTVKPRSTCAIPPACWLPQSLGELRSVACPGGTVSISVCVTNCQPRSSQISVDFAPSELQLTVEPASATLGPMERQRFAAALTVPADASKGQCFEALLWVRGCKEHYLRWQVQVGGNAACASCHEIEVQDCADTVHHWYDHYYCDRACTPGRDDPNSRG